MDRQTKIEKAIDWQTDIQKSHRWEGEKERERRECERETNRTDIQTDMSCLAFSFTFWPADLIIKRHFKFYGRDGNQETRKMSALAACSVASWRIDTPPSGKKTRYFCLFLDLIADDVPGRQTFCCTASAGPTKCNFLNCFNDGYLNKMMVEGLGCEYLGCTLTCLSLVSNRVVISRLPVYCCLWREWGQLGNPC